MKIAVFGGASPKPGETAYENAERLGFLLGSAGHTVMTGGYVGVMEAASKGASAAGAHVIGSTCADLEAWRGTKANPWVKEEWKHANLRDRMYALIDACDAAIVMPGGIGTLAELSVMWNEEVISLKPPRPIIFVGEEWKKTLSTLLENNGVYIKPKDQKRLIFAKNITEAAELIDKFAHNGYEIIL